MRTYSDYENCVKVVGLGAATPIGRCAMSTAAAVRAGIAIFEDHPFMIDREGEPFVVSMATYMSLDLSNAQRMAELAIAAAREALDVVAAERLRLRMRVPVLLGTPSARPGLDGTLNQVLIDSFQNAEFPVQIDEDIMILPNGHSSAIMAMQTGCEMILSGKCDVCLVGGVDSYMDPDTLEWIEDGEQLHKPINAWGFIPGEGAGFNLLCTSAFSKEYELAVLAEIAAINTAHEQNLIKTETVCIGRGLTEAVQNVIHATGSKAKCIDFTICDQNGETYRADEFGFMVVRTNEYFVDSSDFQSPADCWGDVGAASGALFLSLASIAAQKEYGNGPNTLIWTSSETGERSAAIIRTESSQVGE